MQYGQAQAFIMRNVAAPRYIAAGSGVAATAATTGSLPAGVIPGDFMLLVVNTWGGQSISTPSGWTQVSNSPQSQGTGSGSVQLSVFYRFYVAGDAGPSISDSGDHQITQIYNFRGVDRNNPIDTTSGSTEATSDTSVSISGSTTNYPNSLVIGITTHATDGSNNITWDAPVTLGNQFSSTAGSGGGVAIGYVEQVNPGSYGPLTGTYGTATAKALMTVALKAETQYAWFVNAGTWTNGTAGISVPWPTPHKANDLALIVIETRATQSTGTPSGWNQLTGSPQDSGAAGLTETRLAVFWKRAASSAESNVSVGDSGDHQDATILVFANVNPDITPINISAGGTGASGTSFNFPAVTTTRYKTLIVNIITQSNATAAFASSWANANLTEVTEIFDAAGGGSITAGIAAGTGRFADIGTTGQTSVNTSVTTTTSMLTAALEPFPPPSPTQGGQAQAFILNGTATQYAQAQAWIEQTYNGFGQAQAWMDSRCGWGQAQGYILVRARVTTDALEVFAYDSTRTSRVTTDALEIFAYDSTRTSRVTSHALEMFIIPVFYGTGQAQASILAHYGVGQAQADIKQTYYGLAQAQGTLSFGSFGLGQAQADIKTSYTVTGQANASIKQIISVTGQANADIKQTYPLCTDGSGNLIGNFLLGDNILGNEITDVCIGAFGQAQARVISTGFGTGQAQADIKQIYYGLGQSQALILARGFGLGQAQARILQTYYGLGQAQADIKQVYSVYGQAQGDIKQTYFALGQSQARILQTYFGLGQSQATIKTTYYASGQANASMGGINLVYAQAQADIKAISYVFGQANAWIKTTYFGLGQAQSTIKQSYVQCGQAQGQIKNSYTTSGQANADIKTSYTQSGQAQTDIKATSTQSAQAQAFISKSAGYGQAQADILQTYVVAAQAQALVNIPNLGQGYAQANAWIAVQVLLDTFSRTAAVGVGFGTPDIGPAYIDSTTTNYALAGITGSEMILVGNAQYDWVDTDTGLELYDVMAQIDFQFVSDLQPWATYVQINLRWNAYYQVYSYYYLNGDATDSVFAISYVGPNSEYGQLVLDPVGFVPTVNTWYTFKILAHKRDAYVKIWETGAPEPGWQHSLLDMQNTITAGTIITYADVGEPTSFPAVMLYDNYQIFKLSEKLEEQVFGQALAEIWSPYHWAQAQALIDRPIRFGQAAARIRLGAGNTTNPYQTVVIADGPAAYYPLDEPFNGSIPLHDFAYDVIGSYDLVRAYSELGYGPFGGYTGIPGTSGDTAILNHTPSTDQGFNYLYRYGQSIPITSATNWGVEFWINFETYNTGAGTTTILYLGNTNFTSGNISFYMNNNTGVVTALEANTSNSQISIGSFTPTLGSWYHVVLTRGTGNSILYVNGQQIGSVNVTFGTPTDTLFVNPQAGHAERFYLDELVLYTHELTSNRVLEHYFTGIGFRQWYGQAQAKMVATNVNRFGQAQAYMRLYVGYAQAQAKIKAFGVSKSGQAQASITRKEASASSQALIVVTGVQSTGQSRAVIVMVNREVGQAIARILARPLGLGQAMAYIRSTRGHSQAQAYILRPEKWASGQAQATLIRQRTQWFLDTFTRNTSLGVLFPPNPDYGTYKANGVGGSWHNSIQVTGSTAVLNSVVDGTYSYVSMMPIFDTGSVNEIIATMDIRVTELADNVWIYMQVGYLDMYAEYHIYPDNLMSIILYDSNEGTFTSTIPFSINTWYTFKLALIGTTETLTIWKRDEEAEPIPQLSGTNDYTTGFVNGDFEASIGNSLTNVLEIDNINIYSPGFIPPMGMGQAQAYMLGWTNAYGQARAFITKPFGHGQALADIKKTARAFGQARAQIGGQQRRGQARAYIIKGRISVSGQAQAFIWDNQIATGLALAWITKPQPTGQAMAKIIGSMQQRFGLAQSKILAKTITYAHGQAMGIIRGPAFGQAAALIAGAKYLVRYNGYDLPGYAQEESIDSVSRLKVNGAPYVDGSLSEYLGLENKLISLRMKALGSDYANVKTQAQKAATILNSSKGFTKLYIQYWDRYYEAMAKSIKMDKSVGSSMRLAEYTVEFEAKPWLTSIYTTTISGTGLLDTDIINRTIDNGGWTPATLRISGTNVTVSGYTATGNFAGYISISGAVTNFEINTNEYDTTDNSIMNNADYAMYVGPGKTYFNVTGATSCVISWQDRWYL